MSKKSFVNGTLILVAAGLILKVLGFIYRIYISNLIGAEGMGLFYLIFPVYSFIILTLTSGISIGISKMTADQVARNQYSNIKIIVNCGLTIVIIIGTIISIFLYAFLNEFISFVFKDNRVYFSLLIMIPCIPIIAASSALKGYFYGIQKVTPAAVSQIVEQLVKITVVISLAPKIMTYGVEYACALITAGIVVGEIANLIVLIFVYKRKFRRKDTNYNKTYKNNVLKKLTRIAAPISLNKFITSAMSTIELIFIPKMLILYGVSYQFSIEEYGRLTGMALPLIFFPTIFTGALSTTIVASISECKTLNNMDSANNRISKSIKFSFILGFIFSLIFISFPDEISNLLYKGQNIGNILKMLSYTCVFLYLQQTLLGVLNGLDKQGLSLITSSIGYLIRILFVIFAIPIYGLKGYIFGIVLSCGLVCFFNISIVLKATNMNIDFKNWLIKPSIICIFILFISKYIIGFCSVFLQSDKLIVFFAIGLQVSLSFLLMMAWNVIHKNDLVNLFTKKSK